MTDAFPSSARKLLKTMAAIEESIGAKGHCSKESTLAYLEAVDQLAEMLDASQLAGLKIFPRTLKKILVPVQRFGLLDQQVGRVALKLFQKFGDTVLQRKLAVLIATTDDLAKEFSTESTLLYNQLLAEKADDVEVWTEFLFNLSCAQKHSEWLLYSVWALKTMRMPVADSISIQATKCSIGFEVSLWQTIKQDSIDSSTLQVLFMKRLKSLTPDQTGLFLSRIALSLVYSSTAQPFIDLSKVLQTWRQDLVSQYVPWVCGLLEMYLRVPEASFYPISLWLWICHVLNSVPQHLPDQSMLSAGRLFADDCPLGALSTLTFCDWIGHARQLCRDTSIVEYLTCQRGICTLSPSLLHVDTVVVPSPENHLVLSKTKTGPREPEETLDSVIAEISTLKLQRAQLLSTAESTHNAKHTPLLDPAAVYILDTNILLEYHASLDQVLQYHELIFAIPNAVLLELQGLCRGSRRGDVARAVFDFLAAPRRQSKGCLLRVTSHGALIGLCLEDTASERWPEGEDIRSNDDAILWTVKKTVGAVLLTDDINLSLKAAASKVPVFSWSCFIESVVQDC